MRCVFFFVIQAQQQVGQNGKKKNSFDGGRPGHSLAGGRGGMFAANTGRGGSRRPSEGRCLKVLTSLTVQSNLNIL